MAQAAAKAAGRMAKEAAAALLERFTQAPSAHALPEHNRYTDVEVTLLGVEECNREYVELSIDEMLADVRPAMKSDPAVIIFHTNKAMEHIVLIQFKISLECSAIQADRDCHETFRQMVDGRTVLGYKFVITGAR